MDELEYRRPSFSQFGEDGVLSWLFHGVRNGFYVDIGCHHPFRFSNTAVLHRYFQWSGINVDVDPKAVKAFQAVRPNDVNLNVAVAASHGSLDFVMFEEGALNSSDLSSADNPAWSHIPRDIRRANAITLNEILSRHMSKDKRIDLLNIDVEGLDLEILESLDWRAYKPAVIAVESQNLNLEKVHDDPVFRLLQANGYALISHVAITSIYKQQSSI